MAMDDIKQSLNNIDPHSSSFDKEAALRHAKEKGWTEPVPYNYSTTGSQDATEDAFSHPEAAWLSDAVRYEWSDDYGEVGPANPDLEQKLFYSEKLVKAGALIKAYEFEVTLEGPIHIHPVRDVSFLVKLWLTLTDAILVWRCGPPPVDAWERPALPLRNSYAHSSLLHPVNSFGSWHCCMRTNRFVMSHLPGVSPFNCLIYRVWQDRCLFDSYSVKTHGKSTPGRR